MHRWTEALPLSEQRVTTPVVSDWFHTCFLSVGADFAHIFRLEHAMRRLLADAVRFNTLAIDGLWMVDDATDAEVGAKLDVVIISSRFHSYMFRAPHVPTYNVE